MRANPKVPQAFLEGKACKLGNVSTDGQSLFLFGNKIAEHRADGLYITNCGWGTPTTRKFLNELPGVSASQHKHQQTLNGEVWDGAWTKINSDPPPQFDERAVGKLFDLTETYVRIDGWRGYNEPVFAVCGANDTGSWDDSPCPSHVREKELEGFTDLLKMGNIPFKQVVKETSNVFCVHVYIVVPPLYFKEASDLARDYLDKVTTQLFYLCNEERAMA